MPYLFGVPPKIADHARLLNAWAAVSPLHGEVRLPQALNEADNDEDVAIETYDYIRQGR